MSIHKLYTEITNEEREFVDDVMRAAFRLRREDYPADVANLAGDDRAEHVAEALAWWVIASRERPSKDNALPLRPAPSSGPEIVATLHSSIDEQDRCEYEVNPRASRAAQLVSGAAIRYGSMSHAVVDVDIRGERAGALIVHTSDVDALVARLFDVDVTQLDAARRRFHHDDGERHSRAIDG